MTDTDQDIPQLPDRSERVREALLRFETCTSRPSTVMSLDDEQLYDVSYALSDREQSIADAWRDLNATLGTDEQVPRRTFYRFADKFKKLLAQVTSEHAQRRIRMTVAHATDDSIRNMTQLSRHRFTELLTEKLVSTDSLEEIEKYMAKMAGWLADTERARQADERLELDQLNYERRLSETRSNLDLAEQRIAAMQLDTERKQARVDERLTQLQTRLDGLKKRASRGEVITAAQLEHADADLAAVREEVKEAA